ncbi:PEGA domain-containing protein [Cytophagaceae bacterium YF14B1]|uniref:PEGA domain-containing protein n=1 Tax=Xanthocytophaga flava TaxID=3048013 RepID=A0AAE3QVM1_9BACT|nr:PEGA domain-containing protein [Xanthocytophaga flavus]MDJ1484228.1 PEGA domain-containing protein [Xanthocytophaga flavus]
MHKYFIFAGLLLFSMPAVAQESTAISPASQSLPSTSSLAVLIINTNASGGLFIDGESFGTIQANTPKKLSMEVGEHFVQVKSAGQVKNETVNLEAGKKKILDWNLTPVATNATALSTSNSSGEVANLNFTLPGVTTQ